MNWDVWTLSPPTLTRSLRFVDGGVAGCLMSQGALMSVLASGSPF